MNSIRYLGIFLLFAGHSYAGDIYTTFPEQIKADEAYVFYSHGLIVEGTNPRPMHKKFGIYEFPDIKNALAKGSDFNLIAHHRPKNTKISDYTTTLVSWVKVLVESGVPPRNITLIGFSRGGHITAYASSELKELKINTVLLASCWPGGVQSEPPVTFGGHFLSIYETTDVALSCKRLADRSNALLSFDELAISTNKEHGAFFKPMEEWVAPLREWIRAKAVNKAFQRTSR